MPVPCHHPAPYRDGSFLEVELSNPSQASWRAAESGCVLGLLDPLTGAGTPGGGGTGGAGIMQLVVGGDGSALAQAPEVSCSARKLKCVHCLSYVLVAVRVCISPNIPPAL